MQNNFEKITNDDLKAVFKNLADQERVSVVATSAGIESDTFLNFYNDQIFIESKDFKNKPVSIELKEGVDGRFDTVIDSNNRLKIPDSLYLNPNRLLKRVDIQHKNAFISITGYNINANIINMHSQGLAFNYHKNNILKSIELPAKIVLGKHSIDTTIKIKYVKKNKKNLYTYGAKFEDISLSDKLKIVEFISF